MTDADAPKRVYLDQSAFSDIAHQTTSLGTLLREAIARGVAEVWAGPAHMMETAQVQDAAFRSKLARTILDFIGGRRLWRGDEYEAVAHFMDTLDALVEGAVRTRIYFNHHAGTSARVALGALGLLASGHTPDLHSVVERLRRTKLTSQVLHARFAVDPDTFARELRRTVEEGLVTDKDLFADLDKLSLADLERERVELLERAHRLSKGARSSLEKRRDLICRSYAALSVGEMLDHTLPLPIEQDATFDIPRLVNAWPDFQRATKAPSLPKEIAIETNVSALHDPAVTRIVLQQALRGFVEDPNPLPYIGQQVVLRELEYRLNQGQIPTGGLTFDAQHGPAAMVFDIVVVRDKALRRGLRAIAGWIERSTNGRSKPAIVDSDDEVRRVLSLPS